MWSHIRIREKVSALAASLVKTIAMFPAGPTVRKLPHRVDSLKIEASASSRKSDEEVPVHGDPDPGDLG